MSEWKTIKKYYEDEKAAGLWDKAGMNYINYEMVCRVLNIEFITKGWANTKDCKAINTSSSLYPFLRDAGKYNIFDHFFSIKNKNGEIKWVVCPYYYGLSITALISFFIINGIRFEMTIPLKGYVSIIFNPQQFLEDVKRVKPINNKPVCNYYEIEGCLFYKYTF